MVDNYDSFTYNLYQYLREITDEEVRVIRNDVAGVDEIRRMAPRAIIISPGPGRPEDAGISVECIRKLGPTTPILGVCLGHQCIGYVYGADIVRAALPTHGKESVVHHDGQTVFAGITSPLTVGRYHSLVIDPATLPASLEVSAKTEDGVIMAVRSRRDVVEGIQFHPESIMTPAGHTILSNFLRLRAPKETP